MKRRSRTRADEIQSTHWDGCWRDRGHFPCALARLQCLEWEIATLRQGWQPPADDTYQIAPYGADKYEIQDVRAGRSFAITRTRIDAERIIAALKAVPVVSPSHPGAV